MSSAKDISVDILLRIALALKVSADWLLRLDLPQTQYAHSGEALAILDDCSPEEAKLLLDLLKSNKEVLRRRG